MIVPMFKKKIITLLFIEIISGGHSSDPYVFKKERISSIGQTQDVIPNYDQHYLVRLEDKEKESLCIDAKQAAEVDGMVGPGILQPAYQVDKYSITYPNQKPENDVALRCETIPRSYLRLGELTQKGREIKVMLRENVYDTYHYRYKTEMVQSDPVIILNPHSSEENKSKPHPQKIDKMENTKQKSDELKINKSKSDAKSDSPRTDKLEFKNSKSTHPKKAPKLLRLWDHERIDICVAAKNRIVFVVPELQQSEVKKPQWYNFTFADSKENRKILAIDCSSNPPMYVYFGEGDNDVRIIIVYADPIDEKYNKKMLDTIEK